MAAPMETTPTEVAHRLGEYTLVDVRSGEEFVGELGHVAGSKLIPLPDLEDRLAELEKSANLLLICRSGNRSGQACERLAGLGFSAVTNLVGGMLAWNEAGLPVERSMDG